MRINQRFLNYLLSLVAVVLLALGVVLPEVARADAMSSTQSGNTTYYSGGSYAYADTSAVSWATSAGAAYATRASTVRTVAGGAAAVVARAAPAVGAVGSLLSGCFANPLCVVATAAAAAYVANEVGYQYSADASGVPVIRKPDPNVCSTAPCYGYQFRIEGWGQTAWLGSIAEACAAFTPLFDSYYASRGQSTTRITSCTTYTYASTGIKTAYATANNGGGYLAYHQSAAPKPPATAVAAPAELASAVGAKTNWSDTSKLPQLIKDIVSIPPAVGWSPSVPLQSPTVTGPSSIDLGPPSVTTRADGSKTTVTKASSLGYYGPGVSLPVRPGSTMGTYGPAVDVVETTVITDTTPAGVTTTTSTQTAGGTVVGSSPEIKLETCGLPGKPACIMSEAGTPAPVAVTQYDAAADGYRAKADENRSVISGATDKPFFSGWNVFFSAPAVVPCEPMVLPSYKGVSMGSLDACNVVGGVRDVMAYLWAFGGLFLCLGMVKKVV